MKIYNENFLNMRYSKRIFVFSLAIFLGFIGIAQNTYNLPSCLEIAFKHNPDLKSIRLLAKSSQINFRQSQQNLLPSISMNYNLGINNGRNINPATNDFINERLNFSNVGLGFEATVFNGFRLKNTIDQQRALLKASELEIEEAKQNLMLDITLRYLQILNSKDLMVLTEAQLKTTEGQLQRLKSHFEEGLGNPADYTDMQGQYALDEIALFNAKNTYSEAVLALFLLMGIESDLEANFEKLDDPIQTEKYPISAIQVYQEALQSLPTFQARQSRIDAASKGIKVARSGYLPEITLFGQMSSNYSSVTRAFFETGTDVKETGDFVSLNNQNVPVFTNESIFREERVGYFDQFNNNLNSVIGLSIRIPLFDRLQARNTVSLRKIQLQESSVALQNTKLQFKQAIDDAYVKMETAFQRHKVLQNQVTAYESSFRINEIRFENGVSNIVEYLTSKNNLDGARLNLANAKFEYLLRVKILDYYRGMVR